MTVRGLGVLHVWLAQAAALDLQVMVSNHSAKNWIRRIIACPSSSVVGFSTCRYSLSYVIQVMNKDGFSEDDIFIYSCNFLESLIGRTWQANCFCEGSPSLCAGFTIFKSIKTWPNRRKTFTHAPLPEESDNTVAIRLPRKGGGMYLQCHWWGQVGPAHPAQVWLARKCWAAPMIDTLHKKTWLYVADWRLQMKSFSARQTSRKMSRRWLKESAQVESWILLNGMNSDSNDG